MLLPGDLVVALPNEISCRSDDVWIRAQDRIREGSGKECLTGTTILPRSRRPEAPRCRAADRELGDRRELEADLRTSAAARLVVVIVANGAVELELLDDWRVEFGVAGGHL